MLNLYINSVGIMFLALVLWLPILLLITLATPRDLLEKYFRTPHFNAGELIVFGSFPGFFMRTAIFGRLFLTPKAVKGRSMEGFVEDAPKWYRVAVMIFTIGFLGHALYVFGSIGIILIFDL